MYKEHKFVPPVSQWGWQAQGEGETPDLGLGSSHGRGQERGSAASKSAVCNSSRSWLGHLASPVSTVKLPVLFQQVLWKTGVSTIA